MRDSHYAALVGNETNPELWKQAIAYEHQYLLLTQGELTEKADRFGIEIPEKYWDKSDPEQPFLIQPGRAFVSQKIRERRFSSAKDWVAIFSPILSAAIAVLALLVAFKGHK